MQQFVCELKKIFKIFDFMDGHQVYQKLKD